jgi:hypothetical protein
VKLSRAAREVAGALGNLIYRALLKSRAGYRNLVGTHL